MVKMKDKKINKICSSCGYACKQTFKVELISCGMYRSKESFDFIENLDKSKIKTLSEVLVDSESKQNE